jgi:hypothetical protein
MNPLRYLLNDISRLKESAIALNAISSEDFDAKVRPERKRIKLNKKQSMLMNAQSCWHPMRYEIAETTCIPRISDALHGPPSQKFTLLDSLNS